MIKVGVVGATGYAGEEAVKILLNHRKVKLTEVSATRDGEEPIAAINPSLKARTALICRKHDPERISKNIDLAFLCLPHKTSMEMAPIFLKNGKRVIDLSADYRLSPEAYKKWYGEDHKDKANLTHAIYGLPELYAGKIKNAKLIANPGCYPTSIILGIAPILKKKAVDSRYMVVDSKSGATGAGKKADQALMYCEVNENLKAYKANEHQHKPEINKILSAVAGHNVDVVFTPHLVPMNRGILSTIYLRLTKKLETKDVVKIYESFYADKPFVRVCAEGRLPQIKDVVYSNYCDIGLKVTGKTLIIVSCIDNLQKGAAGQAVQNMNIMYGFNEKEGLA